MVAPIAGGSTGSWRRIVFSILRGRPLRTATRRHRRSALLTVTIPFTLDPSSVNNSTENNCFQLGPIVSLIADPTEVAAFVSVQRNKAFPGD